MGSPEPCGSLCLLAKKTAFRKDESKALAESQRLIQLSNIKSDNHLFIDDGHWGRHEAEFL